MKKEFGLVAMTLVGLFLFIFLFFKITRNNETPAVLDTTLIKRYVPVIDTVVSFTRNDSAVLVKLEKKFTYKEDEFTKVGWYRHKSWGRSWPDRKALYAYVNNDGYYYLISNYYGSDWIFHSYVSVKIDSSVYDTNEVPTYSKNNETDNAGGSVWENVSYLGADENGIVELIALHTAQKISVRFQGRQRISDMILSNADKQAIKDCYDLSELIKKKKIKP